jgi:hypothetical protein
MPPEERAAPPAPAADIEDPNGALGWEIAGAVIGSLIAGSVVVAGFTLGVNAQRCVLGCTALLATGAIALFVAPALGVTIAGEASGGQGGFGYALLGELAGVLLSLPGMIAGAIIGYRMSAPDPLPVQPPQAWNMLLLDLRF